MATQILWKHTILLSEVCAANEHSVLVLSSKDLCNQADIHGQTGVSAYLKQEGLSQSVMLHTYQKYYHSFICIVLFLDKKLKRNGIKLCQNGKLNCKNVFSSHLKKYHWFSWFNRTDLFKWCDVIAFSSVCLSHEVGKDTLINFYEIHVYYLSAALVQFFNVMFVLILLHFLFVFISQ